MPEELVTTATEPIPIFTQDELHNLRAIKLTNGNDILACILGTDEKTLIVKRPCLIIRTIESNGIMNFILAKWQPFSTHDIHLINQSSIVTYCKVTSNFMEFYINSIKRQIQEETQPNKPEFVWPSWMDSKLESKQIN
jgi:hypothetical protein